MPAPHRDDGLARGVTRNDAALGASPTRRAGRAGPDVASGEPDPATVPGVTVRVVVAEDGYLIREGLRLLLATQDAVATLADLFAATDEHVPDVVVTDVRMPPGDRDDGIRAAKLIARSHPGLGVVMLSQYVEPEWALRLFEEGAAGQTYLKERVGDLVRGRTRQAFSPPARADPA